MGRCVFGHPCEPAPERVGLLLAERRERRVDVARRDVDQWKRRQLCRIARDVPCALPVAHDPDRLGPFLLGHALVHLDSAGAGTLVARKMRALANVALSAWTGHIYSDRSAALEHLHLAAIKLPPERPKSHGVAGTGLALTNRAQERCARHIRRRIRRPRGNEMARPIWKGAISFGLVNVPVEVFSADQSHELKFAMLDKRDFGPVGYKRYNKVSGEEVPWGEIVKGYEHEKGQYVVMTDEDFRRANVKASQTVEIETFVPRAEIPATYFETPYYLVPSERGQKAYALLRDTLASTDKVGIGQVVIRNKQHLVALIPEDRALVLNFLRYGNEVRGTEGLELPPKSAKEAGLNPRELELARKLIDDMSGDWNPEAFRDTYHQDLMKRIEEKIQRGESKLLTEADGKESEPKSAQVIDLMELLKQSIGGGGKSKSKHAPGKTSAAPKNATDDGADEGSPAEAGRKPASKSAHKSTPREAHKPATKHTAKTASSETPAHKPAATRKRA